ncbi:MAG: methyltransferase domain-containing protein [Acidobacteriota bacterium]
MLLCTVRDCRSPLNGVEPSRFSCARGHSFDVARSGYLNLLQPQDRKSKQPGDTVAAVTGRRRLHDSGVTAPLLEGISAMLPISCDDIVLDAGCGEGFYLGALAEKAGCQAYGVDISIPAIEAAAKRYSSARCRCQWIVANADLFVPFADQSLSIVMSITARQNPSEFQRVLRKDGSLLVAIPGPEDIAELRGPGRDRSVKTIETFAEHFALESQQRITTSADLDASLVEDVLHSIYRPMRAKPVEAMRVTFSLDLLLFRRKV